jgi:hypothetical protein
MGTLGFDHPIPPLNTCGGGGIGVSGKYAPASFGVVRKQAQSPAAAKVYGAD